MNRPSETSDLSDGLGLAPEGRDEEDSVWNQEKKNTRRMANTGCFAIITIFSF